MNAVLLVNDKDNVVTCLRALNSGETVDFPGGSVSVSADIQAFHKVAITDIPKGELCYKYGQIIGRALVDIRAGSHVHVHNIESTRGRGDKGGIS